MTMTLLPVLNPQRRAAVHVAVTRDASARSSRLLWILGLGGTR